MNTSTVKRILPLILSLMLMLSLASCGSSTEKKVVIYSNADEEAKVAMAETLDAKGYKDKYILQSFGTSELGGKIQGEGTNIEADLVTISSYYLDAAQKEKSMFTPLDFDYTPLDEKKDFYAPLLAFEGSIIVNTKVLAENNLPLPTTLKDLSTPQYKGMISMVDLMGSSTGWLMVQAILSEYGDVQGKEVLSGIYNNAGAHLEPSGSGPIKKIRAGEVAIGFGLRHQAVADKAKGLPLDYIDPMEGNFSLQEGIAVVNKGDKTNPLAMEMAKCLVENVRPAIQRNYPVALYQGETVAPEQQSTYPKQFGADLTIELLKAHQQFSESCK